MNEDCLKLRSILNLKQWGILGCPISLIWCLPFGESLRPNRQQADEIFARHSH